jgi:hypothetical protein
VLSGFKAAVSKGYVLDTGEVDHLRKTKQSILHCGDTSASSDDVFVFRKNLNLGDRRKIVMFGWFDEIHSSVTDLNQQICQHSHTCQHPFFSCTYC